jgi:hypothetical protein
MSITHQVTGNSILLLQPDIIIVPLRNIAIGHCSAAPGRAPGDDGRGHRGQERDDPGFHL